MAENTISSSGRQAQERAASLAPQEMEARAVEKRQQSIEPSRQQVKSIDFSSAISMTKVQFMVDSETKDLTIFILDKETDKVVRTIPAEAIKDLPPGQLLNVNG